MKNRRYSDHDRHFWPFTLSKSSMRWFGIELDSGAREDEPGDCHIKLYLPYYVLICELPRIIKDHRRRHEAKTWDAETIARLGRNWYEEVFAKEYGFFFTGEGSLHVCLGRPHSYDADTRTHVFFLPWRQWRYIAIRYYDLKGKLFWTEHASDRSAWEAKKAVEQALPKAYFQIEDYDGEIITAATHIEEREWRFGEGMFSWLSWFRRPKVRRDLSVNFSAEVGKEKGSWKGGMLGHGIEMLPGELHAEAFDRYCQQEFRSKSGRYRIRNLGPAPFSVLEQTPQKQNETASM